QVVAFDAVQDPVAGHLPDQPLRRVVEPRVGQHGNPPGAVDHRAGFAQVDLAVGDVGRTTGGEVAVEGLLHGCHVALLDHDAGDVGPSGRPFADEREDVSGIN